MMTFENPKIAPPPGSHKGHLDLIQGGDPGGFLICPIGRERRTRSFEDIALSGEGKHVGGGDLSEGGGRDRGWERVSSVSSAKFIKLVAATDEHAFLTKIE
jgi:hypothetical protein